MTDAMPASERAAIEAACARLARAFCVFSDARDNARYEALFTPDARFSRPGEEIVGAGAIAAALRDRPAEARVRHLSMDPVVDVLDAGNAQGSGTLIVARAGADGVPAAPLWGDYRDHYVLVDGAWRISVREVSLSFAAP
jgi:hypothetical protein